MHSNRPTPGANLLPLLTPLLVPLPGRPPSLRRIMDDVRVEQTLGGLLRSRPHPNLLPLAPEEEQFEDEEHLYITMPFARNGSLFALLQAHGALAEERARTMLRGLLSGLEHLHTTLGYAHLDLSPENVLVMADGHAVLCDFGLARRLGDALPSGQRPGKSMSVAPELFNARGCDDLKQCDVRRVSDAARRTALSPHRDSPARAARHARLQARRYCVHLRSSLAAATSSSSERARPRVLLALPFCLLGRQLYSLGVVLFNMLYARAPYSLPVSSKDSCFAWIQAGRLAEIVSAMTSTCAPSAAGVELLQSMLWENTEKRLRFGQLRSHRWVTALATPSEPPPHHN